MFGQGLAIVLMVGFLIGFSPVVFIAHQAFAQLIDGDDFNDNSKDTTKWGTDIVKGYGNLEEVNGRLEYTTNGGFRPKDSSDRPWSQLLPADMSWSIEINATNYAAAMGSMWASFGINIESTRYPDDEIEVSLASWEPIAHVLVRASKWRSLRWFNNGNYLAAQLPQFAIIQPPEKIIYGCL